MHFFLGQLAIVVLTVPIWGTLLWVIFEIFIHPYLIPKSEIEAEAGWLMDQFGEQAVEIVEIEEDRAWLYSDSFLQGRYKRVKRAINALEVVKRRHAITENQFPPTSL